MDFKQLFSSFFQEFNSYLRVRVCLKQLASLLKAVYEPFFETDKEIHLKHDVAG